jgi:prolyl oligopeptidase
MQMSQRFAGVLFGVVLLVPMGLARDRSAIARVEPVADIYFGTTVVDPYRWMETPGSTELNAWMHAQNARTRAVFESLVQPRSALLARIGELQAGAAQVRHVTQAGSHYFFLETPVDRAAARLMTRAIAGGDKRVLVDPVALSTGGRRVTVDFHRPSPDGRHVAFVVSSGGGENWVLRVVETATGRLLDDAIATIANPFPSWSADGRGFYYSRLQNRAAGAEDTAKYDNIRVHFHALGTPAELDRAVFGPGVDAAVALPVSSGFPDVDATPDGRWLIAELAQGTDGVRAFWLRDLEAKRPAWRQVATRNDGVSDLIVVDGQAFAIEQKTAANGRIVRFNARKGHLAEAEEWLPPSDIVIALESGFMAAASDALYVGGMRDGVSVLRTLPYARADAATPVSLPVKGSLIEFTSDPGRAGVSLALQAPALSPLVYRYEPARGRFVDTGLRDPDPADFSGVATQRFEVPGTGGARIPVTLTARKDLERDGRNPVLLVAYGSYGVIVPMWFSAPDLAWYEKGGVIAFVHARGGGEKGAAWHEAGRRANKQRTVDDVLAAAQWLIDEGWTSPKHLAMAGKSAGGIAVGGAITQRPDLFRAALFRVAVTDLLRIEHTSGGPANTMEYGTTQDEREFRALHALSPYTRVRDGVAYPAVMLETGINDPRVPPWQLAKMAARLQAATSSGQPILLRVDDDAGHGLGSDKTQVAALLADEYTFLGWQLGLPGFQPAAEEK